jgi:hypothetical protein
MIGWGKGLGEIAEGIADSLGVINGRVGVLDELFDGIPILRKKAGADTAGDMDGISPDLNGAGKIFQYLPSYHGSVGGLGQAVQDNGKFVPALAGHRIALSQAKPYPLGSFP